MQNENSPKLLKVGSIINVIMGVGEALCGALVVASGVLVGSGEVAGSASVIQPLTSIGIPAAHAGFALTGLGILLLVLGIYMVVLGSMGIKACKDHSKIKAVWTLALIDLIVEGVAVVSAVFAGTFGVGMLLGVALSAVVFYAVNDIRYGAAMSASMA